MKGRTWDPCSEFYIENDVSSIRVTKWNLSQPITDLSIVGMRLGEHLVSDLEK